MIGAWIAQAPAALAAAALLIVPGLPAALLLRLRGAALVAGSVAASLGMLAIASVLSYLPGVTFSTLLVVLVAVAVTVVVLIVSVLGRRRVAGALVGDGGGWPVWAAIIGTGAAWMAIIAYGIGDPAHPSQLFDGVFHLNAVEFVLRSGDASPFGMTMATPERESGFYPTLWHAYVALIVPVAGSVTAATNVASIVAIGVIWPTAVAFLTSVLFPKRTAAMVIATAGSLAFIVFPVGFLNWGVLYPNLIGTLQVPLVIGLVVLAWTATGVARWQRALLVVLALCAAGAAAVGHPSAVLMAAVLLVPFGFSTAWRLWRSGTRVTRVVILITAAVILVALLLAWRAATVITGEWLPGGTLAHAVGEVAFLSPVGRASGLLLGPLAAIGIWRVIVARRWWIVVSHGVAVAFFLASAWLPLLGLRGLLVGVWYADTTRVAAMLAMFALPLAGLGGAWVLDRLRSSSRIVIAVVAVFALVGVASHAQAIRGDLRFMRHTAFAFDAGSQGLSPDEVELFERAATLLPDDALVVGDPLTGTAMLYAYEGIDVVFPHINGAYSDDAMVLRLGLRGGGAAVCDAIDALGVTHALDFGDATMFPNYHDPFPGLQDLNRSSVLTEIDRVGDAVLYEVSGCD